MKNWTVRVLALLVTVATTLFVQSPADAVVGPWQVTESHGVAKPIIRDNGTVSLTASCAASQTAVSGYVTSSVSDDLRRLSESFGAGKGGSYSVTVQDQTGAAGTMDVQAHVRCVPTTYFSNSLSVGPTTFAVNDTSHLAEGTLVCPAGWRAVGATVNPSGVTGATLLTFSPTYTLTGWEFRGWHSSISASYSMSVHCVPEADVAALRAYTHFDAVGWGAFAGAECASGMKPLNGGTVHVGGDSGAVTIYPRPTATGWASTTLSLSTGSMQTTVVCVPVANPTVQMIGPNGVVTNATSVSWGFSATDPAAAGGYTISYECTISHPGQTTGPAPCTSPQSFQGLADGPHSIQVVARTSDGRLGNGFAFVYVDTVAPTVDFGDPPATVHGTASPVIGFSVADATPVETLSCWVDGAAPGSCGATTSDYRGPRSVALTGLAEGTHVLHVQATDQAGNTGIHDLAFVVDTVAPTVTMTRPSRPFQLALSTTAAWTGQETGSGIADYSVRWRRAPFNAGFGAWSTPVTVSGATTSKVFASLLPGSTYCYAADARDQAGNASAFAAARCTAVPFDDRSLTRAGGWTASTPSGWFRNTALSTRASGATLSKAGATVKRVSLTALTCPTCGVVGVYVGGVRVGRINLAASTTRRKTVTLPAFSLRTGTVTVKVLSTDKLVKVDALGLSRV